MLRGMHFTNPQFPPNFHAQSLPARIASPRDATRPSSNTHTSPHRRQVRATAADASVASTVHTQDVMNQQSGTLQLQLGKIYTNSVLCSIEAESERGLGKGGKG